MSETVERRLRDVAAEFPRPDPAVTRRVEARLRSRLQALRARRRLKTSGTTVVAALVVAAAVGAGVVAIGAGAATDRVTLVVRPSVLGGSDAAATAVGTVSNERAGEEVVFETRECGQTSFRIFAGATTRAGGAYDADLGIWINSVVRARWKNAVSEEVEVKRRASVGLRQLPRGRFQVSVGGLKYFEGKRARIERWDRGRGRWVAVRHVRLERGWAAGAFVGSSNEVRLQVRKGVSLRAVFPLAQARPCYVGGISRIVTTR